MKTTSIRARALACALLAGTACCGLTARPAAAQAAREFRQLDANGVDLVHGDFVMAFAEGSIGSGRAELALVRQNGSDRTPSQWDGIRLKRTVSGGTATIDIHGPGGRLERFTGGHGATSFAPLRAGGSSLDLSGAVYIHTAPDGTQTLFEDPTGAWETGAPSSFCSPTEQTESPCDMLPTSSGRPEGDTLTFAWDLWAMPDGMGGTSYESRLASVANSYAQQIAFPYQSDGSGDGGAPPSSWFARSGAQFKNTDISSSPQASVSYSYPSSGTVDVTDMAGNVWRITETSIRRPGESSAGFTVTRNGGTGMVSSATRDGVTTSYSRNVSGTTGTMTVTDALSQATTIVSDLTIGRPTSVTDPLSRTTSYTYDGSGRLTRITAPEGDYVELTLDGRGNATQTQAVPKSGSGLSAITATASFDSSCSNPVKCNQPNSVTDARGNTTDYTYDSTHGGLLTVTAPAPTSGATRPETRYAYTLTNGEYQLTGISACATTSSCTDGSDEVKSTLGYDASGNVTSASSGNGSGTLTATGAMAYDAMGNLLTVDGPLSGTADTTRYRYDPARRLVGTTSSDPDGGGSMKPRAARTTYNTSGLPTKMERGTVNSQSDSDWAGFTPLEAVEAGYDANFRATSQKLTSGSTIYALTQVSYDALGRPECAAQRMNPSIFATIATGACSLGTQGSYGPDRITKTVRDAAGQMTQVKTAFGVSGEEANEVTSTYTSNGKLATVTDAEGNKTTYEYDGHDRLVKTRFPDATKGAGTSSTTDYEQPGYDAAGNVTSLRNRAAETIAFTFDNLNRPTLKNLPGSEPDVSYTYDLLGRTTGASQSGNALTFTFDALGRQLTEAGPHGTVTSTYDISGRRTRITHADSFYVDQDFLVTGEMQKIRENGATSGVGVLATFAYDDVGRRTSLTRGNGTTTSYSYDAVSRLSQLADNPAGTTYDQTLGFSYNPASQIVQNTRSNDLFAWAGHGNGSTSSTANGLNQLTAIGGVSTAHDSRGNMTADGLGKTFGYTSENLLTSASGSVTAAYDAMMRLYQVVGAATTRFGYDGADAIAEYNGSNSLQRRFVFGPRVDEPLVWYEGSGTTDRRFLHADERGSIVAVSNGSATVTNVATYDEYGKPGSGNVGRFQYTGQKWIAELGLHDYKSRMLHPSLGRYPQPDPIRYGDGPNFYSYAHADPVSRTDPTGLSSGDCLEVVYTQWEAEFMGSTMVTTPRRTGQRTEKICGGGGGPFAVRGPSFGGGRGGPSLNCLSAARTAEGDEYNCRSETASSSSMPPPQPERTEEEKRLRNCELAARSSSGFGMSTALTWGGFLKGAVGKAVAGLGVAVWYHDAIVEADKVINQCSD